MESLPSDLPIMRQRFRAIPMSDAEKSAVAVLPTSCPEFRVLLGPQCSALLDHGLKIELEGATL